VSNSRETSIQKGEGGVKILVGAKSSGGKSYSDALR